MTAVPGPDATPGQAGLPPLPPKWTGKFRKRPVVIEAVQLVDDDACDWDEIARWCGGLIYNIETSPGAEPQTLIDIPTLEGTMTAGDGWWVVRGVKGEFYPVRPDIFEASHEPAVTPDPGDVTPGQATPEQVLAAVAIVLFEGDEPVELRAERAVEILERNGVNYRGEMAAAAVAQPAPGDLDAAYLYHWRFDRGEEFGLYWHRADADAQAAKHAGEGLTEVLGMAILGDTTLGTTPQPAPSELAERVGQVEDELAEAGQVIDNYREEVSRLTAELARLREAQPVPVTIAPAVARPLFGSTLVLAVHPGQDEELARKGEEAIRAATAGDGVTVVTVRGIEALRTWEPPAAPQPAPELAETLDVRNLLDVATTVTLARARQFLPAPLVAQLHRIREQGALPSLEGK